MEEQNHPLYSIDREHVDHLLAKDIPQNEDFVELARLLLRYEGFPGAEDLKVDMQKILKKWSLTQNQLYQTTRGIWNKGYRPGNKQDDSVGSGFDASESADQ
tara:strand:- start:402 stop:707 length:306 start_codon:yes stop_codon:yes gene_type:complete